MSARKTDLPQGTLDMLILKVVALAPLHGYGIAQRLQQISNDALQIQQGSLYPALHRLENKRWLKASWQLSETGREAKYYTLTRAGEQQLAAENENWDRLARAVRLVMQAD
jgi:transcriptional regulator